MTEITDDEVETILHARKSILFYQGEQWEKVHNPDFDVSMGCYDGAEVAELLVLYTLHLIKEGKILTNNGF